MHTTVIYSILMPTRVARVRHSSAFCLCLSAWENQTGWNYNHQTCHRNNQSAQSRVLTTHLILGQLKRSKGYKMKKTYFRPAIVWPAWVCTLSNGKRLVFRYRLSAWKLIWNLTLSNTKTCFIFVHSFLYVQCVCVHIPSKSVAIIFGTS